MGISVSAKQLKRRGSEWSVALDEALKVMTKLLILFDCFPLCLRFVASLIKFIPWLIFFLIDERQVDDMEWGSVLGRPSRTLLGFINIQKILALEL